MSTESLTAYAHLEWEFLRNKSRVAELLPTIGLPASSQHLDIWRDASYKIAGRVVGNIATVEDARLLHSEPEPVPGSFSEAINIKGYEFPNDFNLGPKPIDQGRHYFLYGCYLGGISQPAVGSDQAHSWSKDVSINRVQRRTRTRAEVKWLTEWHLNGTNTMIFSRFTDRTSSYSYRRVTGPSVNGKASPPLIRSTQSSRDCAFVQTGDFGYVIRKIPQQFMPSWSIGLALEYRAEWGRIPEPNEREATREIVSFVIGRRLMNVGYTTYSGRGRPVQEVAINPWGENLISVCQSPDQAPIPINIMLLPHGDMWRLEEALRQLTPAYLALRDELSLRDALWHYWLCRETAIGIDLPILAAGVEMISKAWFKKKKPKMLYLTKERLDSLLGEEFQTIVTRLKSEPGGEKVIAHLNNANNWSGTDRLLRFLEGIELPIGPVEIDAIKSRHGMAHGSMKGTAADYRPLVVAKNAYQTLFARILLKLLGYDGAYIDYSTLGFPSTPLDTPMHGMPT